MDFEPIEQLLKQAGEQRRRSEPSDPALVANRVIRTIRRRRITRTVTSLLLIGGVIGLAMMNLPTPNPPEQIALPPKPQLQPRVDAELAAIRAEIEMREANIRHLLAIEERSRIQDRLATRLDRLPNNNPTERAAAAAVFEADRMVRLAGLTGPALKSYESVILNFPQSISAEIAKHRVADIKKEG